MTKRLIAILLSLLLLFGVTSCGTYANGKKDNTKSKSNSIESVEKDKEETKSVDSPTLWRATDKEGREIYFFGTIHAGDKRSKAVLKRLHPILEKCDALAVEFDVVAYSEDLLAQQDDVLLYMCEDGSSIKDHISKELYDKLVALFKEQKLYNSVYDRFKPAFWYQLFNEATIKIADLSAEKGMDKLLIKDANSADIEILEVESSDFQNDLLINAPDEYYNIVIGSEIDDVDDATVTIFVPRPRNARNPPSVAIHGGMLR